jgi:hypothetical protein
MRFARALSLVALASLALPLACEKQPPATAAQDAQASSPPPQRVAPTPVPERHVLDPMPTPVRGHFQEVNTGEFDLVDGVAYPSGTGETVVYVTSKTIAGSALASSPCPMTHARFMTALRDAGWNEVALDRDGHSAYFAEGTAFDGSGRESDVGGRYWKAWIEQSNGTALGRVVHREHGRFEFALPVAKPAIAQVSMSEASQGHRGAAGLAALKEPQVAAAYRNARAAAMKKDLDGLLRLQGFDAKQIAAIRGLEGVSADLSRFSDRFLKPGAAGEFQSGPGWGAISASGVNSKGAKFINYYWFTPCGEKLVLTAISENPQ